MWVALVVQVQLVTCLGQRFSTTYILDVFRGSLNQQVCTSRLSEDIKVSTIRFLPCSLDISKDELVTPCEGDIDY
jgi:hypothetical protein